MLEKNDLTSNREDSPGPGLPATATGLIKEGAARGEVIFNDNFPWKKDHCLGIWIMNSSIRKIYSNKDYQLGAN